MAVEIDQKSGLDPATKSNAAPASSAIDETVERTQASLDTIDALQDEIEASRLLDESSIRERGFSLPTDFVLSVIVPVYNEHRTIERVISSLFSLPLPLEVIVVDDGSSDGTCAILTQLNEQYPELVVIFQETNQGKGAALRKGFSRASGSHVMVQDADLEYDPKEIPNLLEPLARDDADAVYGSRFLEARSRGSSLMHQLGNRMLTAASNWSTGLRLTDMETCYKVLRRDLLDRMDLLENGFGFEVELTSKLAKLGARIVERPISYHARDWNEGKKIGWRDGLRALYTICKY